MQAILDTNILIFVADNKPGYRARLSGLSLSGLAISGITAAELEASIYAESDLRDSREASTRPLLGALTIVPFGAEQARAYGWIIERCGYSRRKAANRMTAATALVAGLTVITANPADFVDIPGIALDDWSDAWQSDR